MPSHSTRWHFHLREQIGKQSCFSITEWDAVVAGNGILSLLIYVDAPRASSAIEYQSRNRFWDGIGRGPCGGYVCPSTTLRNVARSGKECFIAAQRLFLSSTLPFPRQECRMGASRWRRCLLLQRIFGGLASNPFWTASGSISCCIGLSPRVWFRKDCTGVVFKC